jgi:hypothetical protein
MSETEKQFSLRDLSRKIADVARAHPAYAQVDAAVTGLCDYLCAVARVEEANREIARLEDALKVKGEALAFYSNEANYLSSGWQGDRDPSLVDRDRGERARAAQSEGRSG